ncbi:MAG: aldehyde dehydrogenase family protein [Halioglobus sp.]|nr:aldehyde dehydrogenase family protein [Halioglobus sp.]
MAEFKLTIDGRVEDAEGTFAVLNPAHETVVGQAPDASREQLDRAVAAARAAFVGWRDTAREQRVAAINAFAGAITDNLDDLARLLTLEQGKPLQEAHNELQACLGWIDAFVHTELSEPVLVDDAESLISYRHRPLGVVGGITPWNAPVLVACNKLIPAVQTGNTVVLKPSPYTPLSTLKLGELAQQAFPAGVVNVLSGGNELGRWMSEHPGIDKLSFTGSTATGKAIMRSGADNLKRLTLELGGNDAAIVLDDVDVPAVVEKLFWGAFYNSGQICTAIKRMYVHADIHDAIAQGLVQYSQYIEMGDGTREGVVLGPVQNKMQFDKVCALAASARQAGGRFLCGGEPRGGAGYFFPVSIVVDLPNDARLVQEEQFGPILPLIRYTDVEQALAWVNAGRQGLGGSVWSADLARAEALARRLESGSAWVNKHMDVRPDVPFGGARESGLGMEHTALGLAEYTQLQVLNIAKQ